MVGSGWVRRDAGLFALAIGWLVLTLGVRPLSVPDEGRYASAAWEMLVSGNWLYPTLNGLPFFHKPPLFYWITATSIALFGVHEWAARLAPALGAALAAFSLYAFALRRASRPVAHLSLMVLVTSPIFYGGAQVAGMDMLVGGFIIASILLAAEAALRAAEAHPHRALLAGAYACAALGVLAKGLMAVALPGLILVLWLSWVRRAGLLWKLLWWPGLVLFAVIALPWFVAMQGRFPGFLHYFFVVQHFERYLQADFNNRRPFWFYLPVLFGGMLPWSLLIVRAVRGARRPTPQRCEACSLMWIAAAVTVGFFSLPSSKMIGYVMAATPPLAFLLAEGVVRHAGSPGSLAPALRAWGIGAALFCLTVLVAQLYLDHHSNRPLGRIVAARRAADEPVYFVEYEYFDVPFYLTLREPVPIFDDWPNLLRSPTGARGDNWHTALADAADFNPTLGARLLLPTDRLPQSLCARPVSWVFAERRSIPRIAVLGRFAPLATEGERGLWRFTRRELEAGAICPQTPSAGSSGTSAPPPPQG